MTTTCCFALILVFLLRLRYFSIPGFAQSSVRLHDNPTMLDENNLSTVDHSIHASPSGNIHVEFYRWFQNYPQWPLIWTSSLLLSLFFALTYSKFFWVAFLVALLVNGYYWQRVRDHFLHGCINPAVVVSTEPLLIAVAANVCRRQENFPAIRIIEASLPSIGGNEPTEGMRLATVSNNLADSGDQPPHWDSFDPRPIECATSDPSAIMEAMKTIDQESWHQLHSWLFHVPRPFQPGLYPIRVTHRTE